MRLRAALSRAYHGLIAYALKFGVVGLGGYAIDVGVFNLLRFRGIADDHWAGTPVGAKVISVTLATIATWFGNRYWTFRDRRRANYWLELAEFALVALVGMGIAVACLYVSHYVLGWQSPLADNISANVVGLILATTFRFLMYRFWVFGSYRADSAARKPDPAKAAS
jgi:putative flippase GtrA